MFSQKKKSRKVYLLQARLNGAFASRGCLTLNAADELIDSVVVIFFVSELYVFAVDERVCFSSH